MPPRNSSQALRRSGQNRGTKVASLERRISELEQLANSQHSELRIQFERIAQLQADWDILRMRLTKSSQSLSRAYANYAANGGRNRHELDGLRRGWPVTGGGHE